MLEGLANRIGDAILRVGRSGIVGPVFVKDFDDKSEEFAFLEQLRDKAMDEHVRASIENDLKLMRLGIQGEKNVLFELQHSFIPILCLHDIRIMYEGLTTQIDFIVITRHQILILETKRLVGDIELTAEGNFNRIFKRANGRVYKKEGMYNPVSQGERQARILSNLLVDKGVIRHTPVLSFAVLANAKNVVNTKNAPQEVRDKLWKYDMLTRNIKHLMDGYEGSVNLSDKKMYEIAELIMSRHRVEDYEAVYRQKYGIHSNHDIIEEGKSLKEALMKYRLETSRSEGVKAFIIFTNKELEAIVSAKPHTLEQLRMLKGFGDVKIEKYGKAIVELVKQYG